MTQIGTSIVVNWQEGIIKQLIENGQWTGFSPRQKQQWLREMNSDANMITQVRLEPQHEMVELFFQRRIPGQAGAAGASTYIAGKWVQLLNFQDVLDEAQKFII